MESKQQRIRERIEERLRGHLRIGTVGTVVNAVLRGEIVHVNSGREPSIVAFRYGVLFIAGKEYVISDE